MITEKISIADIPKTVKEQRWVRALSVSHLLRTARSPENPDSEELNGYCISHEFPAAFTVCIHSLVYIRTDSSVLCRGLYQISQISTNHQNTVY